MVDIRLSFFCTNPKSNILHFSSPSARDLDSRVLPFGAIFRHTGITHMHDSEGPEKLLIFKILKNCGGSK